MLQSSPEPSSEKAAVTEDATANALAEIASANENEPIDALLARLKKSDRKLLDAIRRTRTKFEEELKFIRDGRAGIKDQLQEIKDQIVETKKALDTSQQCSTKIAAALAEIENNQAKAAALGSSSDQLQAKVEKLDQQAKKVILLAQDAAAKSTHVREVFDYATDVKPKVEQLLATAKISASQAQEMAGQARESRGQIEVLKKQASDNVGEVAASIKEIAAFLSELSDAESRIDAYKTGITTHMDAVVALRAQVESLLPDATSAGLAAAFYARAQQFKKPAKTWEVVFVLAVLGLLCVGITWIVSVGSVASVSFESLGISVLERTLLVVPLIWLAFHASSRSSVAKQIEEDYEYKAALARSFEGYKNQLSEIEDEGAKKPLLDLCDKLLMTLSMQPGRLYDRAQPTTPVDAAGGAFRKATAGKRYVMETPVAKAVIEDVSSSSQKESS